MFVLVWMDDGPEHAKWLPEDEKRWLAERLEGEEEVRLTRERHTVGEALKDTRVLAFGALYFCMVVNVYGISFWVGEIVDKVGGLNDVGKGFVTAIPYTVAIVGLVLISRHSDRTGSRKPHVAVSLALGAVAFALSTVVSPVAAIAALAVGLFFLLGAHPVFWSMPAALLSGTAAAAGIALINSIGNLGGFVGPVPRGADEGRHRLHRRRPAHARRPARHRRLPGHAGRPRPGGRARAARGHRALPAHRDRREAGAARHLIPAVHARAAPPAGAHTVVAECTTA